MEAPTVIVTGFFKNNSHPPTCCHITPDGCFFEDRGIFLFSLCFKLMVSQQSPFKIQAILLLPHRWMWKFTRLTNWTYIYMIIYHIFHFFEYCILYVTYHNVYYIYKYCETCIIFQRLCLSYTFISLISLEITCSYDMI